MARTGVPRVRRAGWGASDPPWHHWSCGVAALREPVAAAGTQAAAPAAADDAVVAGTVAAAALCPTALPRMLRAAHRDFDFARLGTGRKVGSEGKEGACRAALKGRGFPSFGPFPPPRLRLPPPPPPRGQLLIPRGELGCNLGAGPPRPPPPTPFPPPPPPLPLLLLLLLSSLSLSLSEPAAAGSKAKRWLCQSGRY